MSSGGSLTRAWSRRGDPRGSCLGVRCLQIRATWYHSGVVAISDMQTGDPLPPQALFRGGADLTPRLGIDVLIDRNTGLLRTDRGISLFADPATVERFGGAYRVESIPEGLKMQQRGRDPGHYELMPAEPMSFERYVELLQQVVLRPVQGE
jgi:hypothetical protein